eukprot:11171486-Lingulodinium_polyedra.AAC.1
MRALPEKPQGDTAPSVQQAAGSSPIPRRSGKRLHRAAISCLSVATRGQIYVQHSCTGNRRAPGLAWP